MARSKSAGRNTSNAGKSAPAANSSKSTTKKATVSKSPAGTGNAKKSPPKKVAAAKSAAVGASIKKAAVKKAIAKKVVKKAIAKKVVQKAVAKKIVRKAAAKGVKAAVVKKAAVKAIAKKVVAKKVADAKSAAAKKAIVKKVVAKKVADAKKVAVKKAIVRNVIAKKVAEKAIKKAIIKKAIARKVVKKALVKKALSKAASKAPQAALLDDRGQLENLLSGLMSEATFFQKIILKGIAKMIKNSSNGALKNLFQKHQSEAEWFLKQLENAFGMLNLKAKPVRSAALEGILQESNAFMAQFPKGPGLDAALIAGSQKFRHYEAAAFIVLRRLARLLGHDKLADIFDTLRQSSRALDQELADLGDESLNNPAVKSINVMADDASTGDSQAGEDSSSHVSGNEENGTPEGSGNGNSYFTGEEVSFNDVADGGDREGPSETGEPMGY